MKIGDNILIICTYQELGNLYRQVLKKYRLDIDIEIMDNRYGKDMDKVLAHINRFREKGKEIIITRGFLARQIRQHLDFKVIEIHISASDVLRVLYPYVNTGYCIGIVESQPYITVARQVAEVLQLKIKEYPVERLEDFESGLRQARLDGVNAVIGGAWHTYDAAYFEDYGIPYGVVESSEESIETSLRNAMEIYELTYEERRRKELLETVVAFSDGGMLALDEKGEVLLMNPYCEQLLGISKDNPEWKKRIREKGWQGQESEAFVEEVDGEYLLFNRVPLLVQGEAAGTVITMKKAEQVQADEILLRKELAKKGLHAKYTLQDIQGKSEKIIQLKKRVERYAATDATVLILGESGTGKELFAQAVHNCSLRRNKPFVAINCSALPASLLESELFGYVDGAFTGAKKGGKAGMFEMAHTGTLFLDEIGDMDFGMQSRFLRALQEKEIMRIGDNQVIRVDVRIIAATNRDLYWEVEEGRFREDLYYRLNLLDIQIPPLRERKEDIPEIAQSMVASINQRLHCHITGYASQVLRQMEQYDWRGNIRELGNVLEKMALTAQFGMVNMEQVAFIFQELDNRGRSGDKSAPLWEASTLADMEEQMIRQAMEKTRGNQTKAAALLGIDRTTLRRKWSKLM